MKRSSVWLMQLRGTRRARSRRVAGSLELIGGVVLLIGASEVVAVEDEERARDSGAADSCDSERVPPRGVRGRWQEAAASDRYANTPSIGSRRCREAQFGKDMTDDGCS